MSSISLQSQFAKLHASRFFMTYMSLLLGVFAPYLFLCLMYLCGLHTLLKNLIYSSCASYLGVLPKAAVVSKKERVKPWFFVTFNIIISTFFLKISLEFLKLFRSYEEFL